MGSISC